MVNVQAEHGYVRLANELMEALAKADLSGQEFRVVFYLIRMTYGWNRKNTRLSIAQIAEATGLDKTITYRTVRSLYGHNVIRADGDNHHPKTYSIQKDYTKWQGVYSEVYTLKCTPGEGVYSEVYTSTSTKCAPQRTHPYHVRKDIKDNGGGSNSDTPPPDTSATTTDEKDKPMLTGAERAKDPAADPLNPWRLAAVELLRYNPAQMQYGGIPGNTKTLKADYEELKTPDEITAQIRLLVKRKISGRSARQLFDELPEDLDEEVRKTRAFLATLPDWPEKPKAQEATS